MGITLGQGFFYSLNVQGKGLREVLSAQSRLSVGLAYALRIRTIAL